ncbi:MAG: DUF3596 domain-containing protein [Desertifilum sp. SIO1I2]|nr:DUF3596 domain-containing protein [Desertifilum sp. SIO1I2]
MYSQTPSGKASKGSCGVESFQGRLRLRLPRSLYGGKQKYLTLGMADTPENRKAAEAKARQIELDILADNFDPTLAKYRPKTHLAVVEPTVTLKSLWSDYVNAKSPNWSPSYIGNEIAAVTTKIEAIPVQEISEATSAQIESWVIKNSCSADAAKRLLTQISSCCNHAVKSQVIKSNPFADMAKEIKTHKERANEEDEIDPFTREERDLIIEAFVTNKFSRYKNINGRNSSHSRYANYIRFMFLTGCRPSEALGLQWRHIHAGFILFEQSVVKCGKSGYICKSGLKTQKSRRFPINKQLRDLLDEMRLNNPEVSLDAALFPGEQEVTGFPHVLNTHSFQQGAWETVLKKLGIRYRKPYQTRHTFITLISNEGSLNVKDVARLCGTSPKMIYEHYLGNKRDLFVPEL